MALQPGARFGRYEIRSKLGAGGMGEVYLAHDDRLDRLVAIKILSNEIAGDPQARRRLIREARSAAALDHPNLCTVHEVGETDGSAFLVMQYIDGETLAARLRRQPFELGEALTCGKAMADGLAEVHAHGIVHRDVKPQNVMITRRGHVKVLDFGLAKVTDAAHMRDEEALTETVLTQTGTIVGSLPYMAPEQVRGEAADARSDVFSFGAVLYELISGRRLFAARTPAEVISSILTTEPPPLTTMVGHVPPHLELVVRRCLEKDLTRRYQTMREVADDLAHVQRERQADAVPRARVRPLTRQRMLSPRVLLASAGSFVLAVLAFLYWTNWADSPKAPQAGRVTIDSPAYDYYVRGKVNAGSENRDNNDSAIKLLEQAVAADAAFAPAYAQLARAYNVKAFYYAPEKDRKALYENAQVALEKAFTLDPDLGEAHFARGHILWTQSSGFQHEQAIRSYKKALALDPNLDEVHHQLGLVYLHIGLFDKAWNEIEQSLTINPANTFARFRFGVIHLYRGEYEEALDIFTSIPAEKNPSLSAFQTATSLFQLKRDAEASTLLEGFLRVHPRDEGGVGTSVKAMIAARHGRRSEVEAAIVRATELGAGFGHFHHTAYNLASARALLGDHTEALRWLQAAAADGFPCYPLFQNDANLASLRGDERFVSFMSRLKQQWQRYLRMF